MKGRRLWPHVMRVVLLTLLLAVTVLHGARAGIDVVAVLLGVGVLTGAAYAAYEALRAMDRWARWQPPAGVTIERRPTEVPVLTDHRSVLGPKAANLITGPGWQAFELVGQAGVEEWIVALPLNRDCGRWKAEPLDPNVSPRLAMALPFASRYLAVFAPPEVKEILAASEVTVQLQCDGDVLFARYPGMGPLNFDGWYAEELPLLERIRYALAPPLMEDHGPRAIGSSPSFNAGRNVWSPGDSAPGRESEPFPVLPAPEQPRRWPDP